MKWEQVLHQQNFYLTALTCQVPYFAFLYLTSAFTTAKCHHCCIGPFYQIEGNHFITWKAAQNCIHIEKFSSSHGTIFRKRLKYFSIWAKNPMCFNSGILCSPFLCRLHSLVGPFALYGSASLLKGEWMLECSTSEAHEHDPSKTTFPRRTAHKGSG